MDKCDNCEHKFKAKPEPAETAFQVAARAWLVKSSSESISQKPWGEIEDFGRKSLLNLRTFWNNALAEAQRAAKSSDYFGYGLLNYAILYDRIEKIKEKV